MRIQNHCCFFFFFTIICKLTPFTFFCTNCRIRGRGPVNLETFGDVYVADFWCCTGLALASSQMSAPLLPPPPPQ